MPKKRYRSEEIIHKILEAKVAFSRGKSTVQVCKKLGVAEQTYYRWRREYGALKVDQAIKLKELEQENARLKRLFAEAELDKTISKEVASGKLMSPAKRQQGVEHVRGSLGRTKVSERHAYRILGQLRSTQRRKQNIPRAEPRLV